MFRDIQAEMDAEMRQKLLKAKPNTEGRMWCEAAQKAVPYSIDERGNITIDFGSGTKYNPSQGLIQRTTLPGLTHNVSRAGRGRHY